MKFPGQRKRKHYFPVGQGSRVPFDFDFLKRGSVYVVGIDQLLVDIEVEVEDDFLLDHGLKKGESLILEDDHAQALYEELKQTDRIVGEFAGGSVGNTLHNYCMLSDGRCVALGAITKNFTMNDYAFNYVCSTSSKVDFSRLQPCEGHMGRALCFITPDGERTFGISQGVMNDLTPEFIPSEVVAHSAALLISTYLMRDPEAPIYQAALKACEVAKANNVPVVLALGTSMIVQENREDLLDFIDKYVTVLAMNEQESFSLTQLEDPLLSAQKALDLCDLVLLTVGNKGLYLCGHVDEENARETRFALHSKSIAEYNKYEFSRAMRKEQCENPLKFYSHINPYMGGPEVITNTNGAGDGALSALLHDIAANQYHREIVPNSPKHNGTFLTYSSLCQVAQYASRVSYEILVERSPRLFRGLPQTADCLEQSHWIR